MQIEFARGNTGTTDAESVEYFHVNNCGYYVGIDVDIRVNRPHGRRDYQLIYVHTGSLDVMLHGIVRAVPAGYALFFAPGEPQQYRASANGSSSYYWMHFTGRACPGILAASGIAAPVFPAPGGAEFADGCRAIVQEMHGAQNESYINGRAICMLARVHGAAEGRFGGVTAQMAADAADGRCSDYAGLAGMSPSHFIRCFKAERHVTPNVYLTRLRMEKAQLLLRETDLKIREVAARLGYDDPFYFSNVFKKYTGISPTQYRDR